MSKLRGFKYYSFEECNLMNFIRENFLKLGQKYNLQFFISPLLAKSNLFLSLGENSDIVKKELYSFIQKDGESVCLIPEYTRIFVEEMIEKNIFNGLFGTFGPCFRYERPQKGRFRSFYQISVECIGNDYFMKDVELILFIEEFLKILNIKNYQLNINTIGNKEERNLYLKDLEKYFSSCIHFMSLNSQEKFKNKSFLRLLDSKEEIDLIYINNVPQIKKYLSKNSLEKYENIKSTLNYFNIQFKENPFLVRGLDYYNDLVFEYTHSTLGAQNSFIGGGRYDYLFSSINNKFVPAVGFGIGIERLMHILIEEKNENLLKKKEKIAILSINEPIYALEIFQKINLKYTVNIFYEISLSKGLKKINNLSYKSVIILGEDEKKINKINYKNLETSNHMIISVEDFLKF